MTRKTTSESPKINVSCDTRSADTLDPWSRLNYQDGQLLSKNDFLQEQTYFLIQNRLHNAVLHGFGTIRGLKVYRKQNPSRLYIKPGLAVDITGRMIHVDSGSTDPCLDVSGLHKHALWQNLEKKDKTTLPPDVSCPEATDDVQGELKVSENCEQQSVASEQEANKSEISAAGANIEANKHAASEPIQPAFKQGWIVISHQSRRHQETRTFTSSTCAESVEESRKTTRISDGFCAEIIAKPPGQQNSMADWYREDKMLEQAGCWSDLRERLLHKIIDDEAFMQSFPEKEATPILLARIIFCYANGKTSIVDIDNYVRPIIPNAQLFAEQVFRQQLTAKDKRASLKLLAINSLLNIDKKKGNFTFELTFSQSLNPETFSPDSIQVFQLDNTGWCGDLGIKTKTEGNKAWITIKNCIAELEAVFQIHLGGAGTQPVLSADGLPLDGWWDEPVSGYGRGRNVSVVRTWSRAGKHKGGDDGQGY